MMLWKVLHSIFNMHSICNMPAPGRGVVEMLVAKWTSSRSGVGAGQESAALIPGVGGACQAVGVALGREVPGRPVSGEEASLIPPQWRRGGSRGNRALLVLEGWAFTQRF